MFQLNFKPYHVILESLNFPKNKSANKIKILPLHNFNNSVLENYIQYQLNEQFINSFFLKTEFDQIDQKLYSKTFLSEIKKIDFILLGSDINTIDALNEKKINDYLINLQKNILYIIKNYSKYKLINSSLIIFNINYPSSMHLTTQSNEYKCKKKIDKFNKYLEALSKKHINIKILDIFSLSSRIGSYNFYDYRNFYSSKILYSELAHNCLSIEIKKIINSTINTNKKCLVLDLDNTLWEGVLGETRSKEIDLGKTYKGQCFRNFQKYLKILLNKGIILAICSKNNTADVFNFFKMNKEMVLSLKDFQSKQINWDHKFINIRKISEELNIGLDSMVFFDDSPLERAEMKKMNPQVTVLDFPDHPEHFIHCIENTGFFFKSKNTKEDKEKKNQYSILEKAKSLNLQINNVHEFRKSLKMEIEISKINKFNFDRCCQLINKTNQFNLRTKRYTEPELNNFVKTKENYVFALRLKDRFGDHGITALIMLKKKSAKSYFIENLLLSCRILGRDIEYIFLKEILDKIKLKNVSRIESEYVNSPKNEQCKNFFENCNFTRLKKNLFFIDLNNKKIIIKKHNVKIYYA